MTGPDQTPSPLIELQIELEVAEIQIERLREKLRNLLIELSKQEDEFTALHRHLDSRPDETGAQQRRAEQESVVAADQNNSDAP